jgi:hypothetical protein
MADAAGTNAGPSGQSRIAQSTQRRKDPKAQREKQKLGKQKAEMLCRFASLQCYLRKLCILRKVFHALFSLFAPVHVVWLRLAALRLGGFALKNLLYPEIREIREIRGQFLWLRLAAPAISRLFSENRRKLLAINNLHKKEFLSDQTSIEG